jgi:hypothetical protein
VPSKSLLSTAIAAMLAACSTVTPPPSARLTPTDASPTDASLDVALGPASSPIVGGLFGGNGSVFGYDAMPIADGFVVGGVSIAPDYNPVRGAIWRSPDGLSWFPATSPQAGFNDSEVDHLATDGNLMVAIGVARHGSGDGVTSPVVWRSRDGFEWDRLDGAMESLGGFRVQGLSGDEGGFVVWGLAVDGSSQVLTSTGGVLWTPTEPTEFSDADIFGVEPYQGGLLAVGGTRQPNAAPSDTSAPARAWWSSDRTSWHPATVAAGFGISSIYRGSEGLLALGAPEHMSPVPTWVIWHSIDGHAWEIAIERARADAYASDGRRIVRWDSRGSGAMEVSTDGLAWKALGTVTAGGMPTSTFALGNSGVLLVLYDSARVDAGVQFIPYASAGEVPATE